MDNEDFGRNNPPFQHYIPSCYGEYQRYIPSCYSKESKALSNEYAEALNTPEVKKRSTSKSTQDRLVAVK